MEACGGEGAKVGADRKLIAIRPATCGARKARCKTVPVALLPGFEGPLTTIARGRCLARRETCVHATNNYQKNGRPGKIQTEPPCAPGCADPSRGAVKRTWTGSGQNGSTPARR